ncbi:MAG: CPBP family intramembrane metalloprotease [Acidobacteria bacterium]|nr:CPBP family intramembrane metalloprotease [Acidobacteriota bacterium]
MATAALGALWGAVYLVRRSVAAPIVSHAGFNLAEVGRHVITVVGLKS